MKKYVLVQEGTAECREFATLQAALDAFTEEIRNNPYGRPMELREESVEVVCSFRC